MSNTRKLTEWVVEAGGGPVRSCPYCKEKLSPGDKVTLIEVLDADRAVFLSKDEATVIPLDTYIAGIVHHTACADASGVTVQ